jgi:hypothetical protein
LYKCWYKNGKKPATFIYQYFQVHEVNYIMMHNEISAITNNRRHVYGDLCHQYYLLVDRGRVRPLLTDTKIEVIASSKESASGVTVTDEYQERYRYTYALPPSGSLREGLTENDSVYTLNVGKHFDPWLKKGYRVRYDIIVTQVTKMGVVYTQEKSIEFIPQ